jgi:hypothetical protein
MEYLRAVAVTDVACEAEVAEQTGGSSSPNCHEPADSGVAEGGDGDELVTGPLAGLGELEVERLSGGRNHVAVGQGHG